MAKTLVTVIDSSGKEFRSRRSWAETKRSNGVCDLGADGIYRFQAHSQSNGGAGSVSGLAGHRDRTVILPPVRLRPDEPTPDYVSFLSYPQPRGGRSLRAQYPTLARAGAGLR
jgi:hypothetical protein